ncbi:Conserved protein of uncharacterised function, thought to be involved in the persistence in the host [Mycolicibacterium flavescens]|uniref:hypothetical protein n=1 Tax=Mycobacterium neumannii TaxID=2048551 RepID=UPI000B93ECC1|nr:hypothetical protein [Mycobacterium neumannii]VEG42440.1 Conserved protein of uncharacterised function, thought to be involved in the persistence in the host [Mycolicibacterium flavescens]
MYARSTTIHARPSSIDDGIAFIRSEVMPALEAVDGFVGLSLLVDRESGHCIATSAWDSEDALRASTERAAPLRDRAAEALGGEATVDQWQIGVMHRDHRSADGACVRATWLRVPREHVARSIAFFKTEVLPALEELHGFCSASYLINPDSGRAVASATFDSHEAMVENRDQARELRNTRTRELGADIVDVGEFDLALAHLRIPEMV